MNQAKRTPRVVGLLLLACFAVACAPTDEPTVQRLTLVVREGLEAEGLRRVAEEWAELRNVQVSVEALGRGNYEVVTKRDLQAVEPRYDVVFFPGTLVAELAAKGALAPIENWTPESDPDLLAYSAFRGKVYGLPCDISSFFSFYRSDVVASVPETWHDLLEMAPAWSAHQDVDSTTTYGFAFAGQAGEELPKIFYPILWSYGGFLLEDGEVGLDSANAVAAADMFRRLASSPAAPPEIETWNILRILDELQAGTLAFTAPQWNALFPLLRDNPDPIPQSIQIAPIPGVRREDGTIVRTNFKHTWVLIKPARGASLQLANDFILFATGPEGGRLYARTARGNPARRSLLSDPELQAERVEFSFLLDAVENAKAEPEVPYYSELHETMNTALSSIISGSKGPREALQEAAARIRELEATVEVNR